MLASAKIGQKQGWDAVLFSLEGKTIRLNENMANKRLFESIFAWKKRATI